MRVLRNSILVIMAVNAILQVVACDSLALSGDKRYKSELNSVLLNAQQDVDREGAVGATTVKKVEKLLAKYKADYSEKGSYLRTQEMLDLIKQAEADQANAFNLYRQALQKKSEAESYLTTEIKE